MSDYWETCIKEAFGEYEIKATDEQVNNVIEWVEGAHENYGMSHGHECIADTDIQEIERLQKELKTEKDKVHCEKCSGQGRIISLCGSSHYSNTECWKCRGEGRHSL